MEEIVFGLLNSIGYFVRKGLTGFWGKVSSAQSNEDPTKENDTEVKMVVDTWLGFIVVIAIITGIVFAYKTFYNNAYSGKRKVW